MTAGPPSELLSGLFDLTPAEAQLARVLVAGRSLRVAAEAAGISIGTARERLKQVQAKTATHRQAELVSLLGSVHMVRRNRTDQSHH
jgi:DNA-binding CsgD family transcriptional regulator